MPTVKKFRELTAAELQKMAPETRIKVYVEAVRRMIEDHLNGDLPDEMLEASLTAQAAGLALYSRRAALLEASDVLRKTMYERGCMKCFARVPHTVAAKIVREMAKGKV